MHLVDRVRRIERVAPPADAHPLGVLPLVVEIPDHGAGLRRRLAAKCVGIGLVDLVAIVLGRDVVLVDASLLRFGHACIPDARGIARLPHRMPARVPAVEFAYHRNRGRVGRPHRELGGPLGEMRAELLVETRMGPFAEKVEVVTGQRETGSGDSAHGQPFITTRLGDLPRWLYFWPCRPTTFSASCSRSSTSADALPASRAPGSGCSTG